jgi:transposase-like protein
MSTINQRSGGKERFWRTMVRQWRRSGQTARAFCVAHDLSEPSFYAWRRTLAQRDAEAVHFVPVKVVPERASASAADQASVGLELVLDGRRVLRIGPGFDTATLQRLLPLLEEGRPCC